ncbi:MAG: S8 family serine peptidase, partial [Myxococcota bacterium]
MTRARPLLVLCLLAAPAALHPDPASGSRPIRLPAGIAARLTTVDPATDAPEPGPAPYVAGQYLVAPPPDTSLDQLAARLGGEVIAPVGRSGYGVVHTDHPERWASTGVAPAPLGRIVGAGKWKSSSTSSSTSTTPSSTPPTWHLSAIGAPTTAAGSASFADWRVAVLDTGVAYEAYGAYVRAPGLSGVAFEDPLDLVNGDEHPNDDHQHGTHITSLIAGQGLIPGVAPGATIVPVKVLDAHNTGTEYALIEGLYHAIDHDVDVINLSVSFPLGYVPSRALRDALEAAWDAQIVVVAAAGNDGERELTWPAASRLVLSVGASRSVVSWTEQTTYSNTSPRLDILAPGGQLDVDANADGFVDGVVAETIDPTNPARVGYWAYQGTSQATALVSGLAVRLLADGVAPSDVGPAIQQSRGGFDAWDAKLTGTGSDIADLATALASRARHDPVYVGLLPYVADLGWAHDPRARVVALDASGAPLEGVDVIGSLHSAEGVWWPLCTTDATGACTLKTLDFFGKSDAWAFRVDAVVVDGVAQRPARAVFASTGADVMLTALLDSPEAWDAVGVYWPAGDAAELGLLAEAWAVVDS